MTPVPCELKGMREMKRGTEIRTEDGRMALTFTRDTTLGEFFESIKALANINYQAGYAEGFATGYAKGHELAKSGE